MNFQLFFVNLFASATDPSQTNIIVQFYFFVSLFIEYTGWWCEYNKSKGRADMMALYRRIITSWKKKEKKPSSDQQPRHSIRSARIREPSSPTGNLYVYLIPSIFKEGRAPGKLSAPLVSSIFRWLPSVSASSSTHRPITRQRVLNNNIKRQLFPNNSDYTGVK